MNGDAPEFLPDGLITSPQRFVAGGAYVGLKTYAPNKMDVGLLLSELPCRTAGVYTTNKFVSPSVTLTRQNVAGGNVRGVFVCLKAVVPQMKEQGYGKIVNISSATVQAGVPWFLHYVSSKGAVDAMTRAAARELGDFGIRVNSIAPGFTMSEQIESQREDLQFNLDMNLAGRAFKREEMPEDLLGTMVFLASAESDFMSGQTVVVDGGLVMH